MPFNNNTTYKFYANWNQVPAVYGIFDAYGRILYIGQTDNLRRRMSEHQANASHLMHRYYPALVLVEAIQDEKVRYLRERQLINEYQPPCNQC